MSSGDSNFDSAGDAPLSATLPAALARIPEELLLAWIEGELSPTEVSGLAQQHPEAVALVAAMRRDRAGLAVMAGAEGVSAPSDLADRVMAAVEREALLGLSQGEPISDSLPISQVPKRKTQRQIWWQQATPRLALAAGLTLVVSAGAILALRGGGTKPGGGVGPVAINDVDPTTPEPMAVTRSAGDAKETNADSANARLANADTGQTPEAPAAMVAAPAAKVASTAIDAERAAILASEGRLVLRVRDVATAAAARLDSPRARVSSAWRVQGQLPATTVAMLAPTSTGTSRARAFTPPDWMPAMVARATNEIGGVGPVADRPAPSARPLEFGPLPPTQRGSVVDVREDGESIEDARLQLSKLLGREVEFEESDRSISITGSATTPESVLWWTQPPRTWAPRVRVPLIVEMR